LKIKITLEHLRVWVNNFLTEKVKSFLSYLTADNTILKKRDVTITAEIPINIYNDTLKASFN